MPYATRWFSHELSFSVFKNVKLVKQETLLKTPLRVFKALQKYSLYRLMQQILTRLNSITS
ncbi:hypothetical protein KSF78_0009577 [Schistosoma japonicum]|nr:hypothetical protein KSF78_0009577 [Schistosoma japonicum]